MHGAFRALATSEMTHSEGNLPIHPNHHDSLQVDHTSKPTCADIVVILMMMILMTMGMI